MPDLIFLRPMQLSDLPLFQKWLALPHVSTWYHDPEDWIYEIVHQEDEFSFLRHLIVGSGGKPIGFCQYYPYWLSGEEWHGTTPLEGTYSIDYMIGDTAFLGKGYGKRIILALLDQIRLLPDASRVIVQPEPENQASCGVLRSCGFQFDETNHLFILKV